MILLIKKFPALVQLDCLNCVSDNLDEILIHLVLSSHAIVAAGVSPKKLPNASNAAKVQLPMNL